MGILLYYLFPLLILAAAAALGLVTVALASPNKSSRNNSYDRKMMAMWLAPSLPVVAATSFLVSRSDEFQKLYGPFLSLLWLWALIAFLNGILVGWLYFRHEK